MGVNLDGGDESFVTVIISQTYFRVKMQIVTESEKSGPRKWVPMIECTQDDRSQKMVFGDNTKTSYIYIF